MKVILLKEVERLGKIGETVEVKPGYARNKLIPSNLALMYSEANFKRFKEIEKLAEVRKEKKKREVLRVKEKLEALSLTIPVQAGEDNKLFGAVTNIDIEEVLAKEGYKIDRKDIVLDEPIKELGVYSIEVLLPAEIKAMVKVWVVSK
ncbi:MAG: 50S ribosomal protein L9 [Candidatus Stahlbacteria bacterium]|nr:50S ribosomal protein L9 [Candidatus Stahlbacteria bacterium]